MQIWWDIELLDTSLGPKYGKKLRVSGTKSKQDPISFINTSPTAYFPPYQRQLLGTETAGYVNERN